MNPILYRLYNSFLLALPKAFKTIIWLLKIILPISFVVSLLQYWGIIAIVASFLAPVFSIVGLPGEAAIVFITSIFMALYAPIAIIATLPLGIREITILAIMCLISHNLIVETTVQKKTGSSPWIIFFLRIIASFVAAFLLNKILPDNMGKAQIVEKAIIFKSFGEMFQHWLINTGWLILKIVLIITGLMILQNILKEFHILEYLSKIFAPLMKIMGLSQNTTFLWFVAQIVGLTYGSAIMIEEVTNNSITVEDANLLNYHIAVNHSLLEDTLLFVAIGVPAGWIIVPRFILAILIVWSFRGIHSFESYLKQKQAKFADFS
ncbi:MAG TPA: nucleoside recognition domain-containing protein [Paludibacteraceae bacterium]|nr:nucleoside recognition domain-containing protein [Paludibacteraceae bacterium]HOL00470.1 nucleoside recognition domain-containing protein [Paludibacteraceae bacterium]HPO67777.1 nucleoside recognition domain-containing protein [Paludibacteraceae bacterium]HRU63909.1 nucleoside recognition domain-containing protein [Paludibacteraceae bacterium]